MEIPVDFLIRAGQTDTTETLREYTARRLSFALRRFSHRIRHITVRVVDVNGPRGGVDTRCSMTAKLADGRQLFVDATAAWPFAAVTDAARRLSEAARRDHTRHASHRGATSDLQGSGSKDPYVS